MSIVLDALAKAQKKTEEQKVVSKDIVSPSSLEQPQELRKNIHPPSPSGNLGKRNIFKKHKILFYAGIVCIIAVSGIYAGWMLTSNMEQEIQEPAAIDIQDNSETVVVQKDPGDLVNSLVYIPENAVTEKDIESSVPAVDEFSGFAEHTKEEMIQYPDLKIEGILWDPIQPLMLVNGKFIAEGDSFQGAIVKKIYQYEAVFEINGSEFTVNIQK